MEAVIREPGQAQWFPTRPPRAPWCFMRRLTGCCGLEQCRQYVSRGFQASVSTSVALAPSSVALVSTSKAPVTTSVALVTSSDALVPVKGADS